MTAKKLTVYPIGEKKVISNQALLRAIEKFPILMPRLDRYDQDCLKIIEQARQKRPEAWWR